MRRVRKTVPFLLPLFLLVPLLYFLFPRSSEPANTSTISSLVPVQIWSQGFSQLRGVAVDGNGLVYVADRIAGTVTRIEADQTQTIVAGQLQRPIGLAFDLSGRLLRGLL